MVFAVLWSTIGVAQTQGLAGQNAPAAAQNKVPRGRVMFPASSIAHAGDQGLRAHTHLPSVITAKVANDYHFKSGQRK
jgi:hypothetical protein